MSNYVKLTDFAVKDGLASGNPSKLVKGYEIDDEFDAIATAVATKFEAGGNLASSTATTQAVSDNSTKVATTAFVHLLLADVNIVTGGTF